MSKKVIIMDDEPIFMGSTIGLLGALGFPTDRIIYCTQIDEAFRALSSERNNIACLSLDLLIGDNTKILKGDNKINGLKAFLQIKEMYPDLPIVCFSILGYGEGGSREILEKYKTPFISKTDDDGPEKLMEFFNNYI